MNKLTLSILLLSFIAAPSGAQNQHLTVEKDGFRADWFHSGNTGSPVIIMLGGSEGGLSFGNLWAPWLNESGYHVLSLAYFNLENLPVELELVPLEYMDYAIAWLDSLDEINAEVIGLIGVSKGAELALLQAARIHRFNAVVAISPSSVVWQSINRENYYSVNSSWSLDGEPVDFLPYCHERGFDSIFNFYDCALDNIRNKKAIIPVEQIRAPLLLLSGGHDRLWPSLRMSEMITERLSSHSYPVYHKNHSSAGHWLAAPHLDKSGDPPEQSIFDFLGGSPEEFFDISRNVEKQIMHFWDTRLKGE